MAKKAKAKAKKKSGKRKVKADTKKKAIQLITQANLVTLMNRVASLQKDVSSASGNMGDLIREYADKKGLHRGAFQVIKKLRIMGKTDPSKLWLFLAHLDDMRAKLKLDDLAEEQGQLIEAIPEEKEAAPAAKKKPAATTIKNELLPAVNPTPLEEAISGKPN